MSTAKTWDERIGRRLKLRDLHIFMTVAQRRSMGKAAADLAVSQPAVSKAIADLEHTIGARLLDRTALGVEPTLYGEALLKWGGVVFDDLRQGVEELEFLANPTAGEIRISTTEPMAAGLVPAVVDRVSRQYPRLVINVLQAATVPLQYAALRERKVDLILGRMVTPIPDEDVNLEILFMDPFRVVAGANNRWARRRKVALVDLAEEAWTLPQRDGWIGPAVVEALHASGLNALPHVVFSNSIQLHNALMATGRFFTVLSASTVRFSGKRLALKILPIDLPIAAGAVGIVTLKNRTLSPVTKLFIECAREVASTLADRK
jgi:DNA-binding transcriptional LysR family regulator